MWICTFFQDAEEYTDLPVRHNEDHMNSELAKCLLWNRILIHLQLTPKQYLLLQAHLSQFMLPCPDYDTNKTVLDQALLSMPGMKVISNCLHFLLFFLDFYSPVREENILLCLNTFIVALLRNLVNEIKNFWRKRKCKCTRWQFQPSIPLTFIEGKLSTRYFLRVLSIQQWTGQKRPCCNGLSLEK